MLCLINETRTSYLPEIAGFRIRNETETSCSDLKGQKTALRSQIRMLRFVTARKQPQLSQITTPGFVSASIVVLARLSTAATLSPALRLRLISRIILLPDSVPEDYNNYSLWTGAA